MDAIVHEFLVGFPTIIVLAVIAVSLFTLGKGADILVDEAVSLSVRWGVPKMIIGATIVSLGTTLPEATVSVLAAVQGNPGLALGNAVGSIIADTGLIIGISALLGSLPIIKEKIDRQGRIQLMAGILLVVVSLPIFASGDTGNVSQWMGFVFLALLVTYLVLMMRWARRSDENELSEVDIDHSGIIIQIIKFVFGIALVILSSKVLIPAVEITAHRVGIPQAVIAATLVAFGTSLPELVTSVTAVRKGHGELAVGNIIGADILNVLFVVGAAAAVTKGGLAVPASFYRLQFPAMLIILGAFRFFAKNDRSVITKLEGTFLLGIYLIYLVLNFVWI